MAKSKVAQVVRMAKIEMTTVFGFANNNQPRTAPSNRVGDMHRILYCLSMLVFELCCYVDIRDIHVYCG